LSIYITSKIGIGVTVDSFVARLEQEISSAGKLEETKETDQKGEVILGWVQGKAGECPNGESKIGPGTKHQIHK